MRITSSQDLFEHHLHDLRSAEEQIVAALPTMITGGTDSRLQTALEDHLAVSENQITRLDTIHDKLGIKHVDQECAGIKGIIEEGEMALGQIDDAATKDAAIISAAQKVEHYEIACYGTSAQFARELNLDEVAALLEETLAEEEQADADLTELAEGGFFSEGINEEAVDEA